MRAGRSILITGATSGIGRDAAVRLVRGGHLVMAGGRRADALASLARAGGGRLEPVVLDVTDPASVEAARELVERRTGGRGLDVLVNNAGFALPGPLEALAERDLRELFDTNVLGLLVVTRAFLPAMRERGQGRGAGPLRDHRGPGRAGCHRDGVRGQGPGRPRPLPRPHLPVRPRPGQHRRRLGPRLPPRPRPRAQAPGGGA
jgi:hypothetical protein